MSIALVGPSGSGKSSLSKLLLRLYDPIGGGIIVGGVHLTEVNLKWWRQQIGYVSQEPSLFPGTIRDNIAAGKIEGDATDEEVEAAAKAASAADFIADLPDGYNTFYSGSSIQLSGELGICFLPLHYIYSHIHLSYHFYRWTDPANQYCKGFDKEPKDPSA